jgi:tRNA dimethylallyltransferase
MFPDSEAYSLRETTPMLRLLLGPTASGKTAVALALARRDPTEVISADSRQVYRALDIGTAKSTLGERERVPHHMLDIIDPDATMSAGRFAREAYAAVADVRARGREPLVVGGAGLYVRALLGGLAADLPRDLEVRARLEHEAEVWGNAALHARLGIVDPEAADRIAPQDRLRIVRALEVMEITGRPITRLQRESAAVVPTNRAHAVYLAREPADLEQRITIRARAMLDAGLVAETRAVLDRWPAARGLLEKTVGYAEILETAVGAAHPSPPSSDPRALVEAIGRLDMLLDHAPANREALARAIARSTRQYARRQRIWFQKTPDLVRLAVDPTESPETTAERLHALFRRGRANGRAA